MQRPGRAPAGLDPERGNRVTPPGNAADRPGVTGPGEAGHRIIPSRPRRRRWMDASEVADTTIWPWLGSVIGRRTAPARHPRHHSSGTPRRDGDRSSSTSRRAGTRRRIATAPGNRPYHATGHAMGHATGHAARHSAAHARDSAGEAHPRHLGACLLRLLRRANRGAVRRPRCQRPALRQAAVCALRGASAQRARPVPRLRRGRARPPAGRRWACPAGQSAAGAAALAAPCAGRHQRSAGAAAPDRRRPAAALLARLALRRADRLRAARRLARPPRAGAGPAPCRCRTAPALAGRSRHQRRRFVPRHRRLGERACRAAAQHRARAPAGKR